MDADLAVDEETQDEAKAGTKPPASDGGTNDEGLEDSGAADGQPPSTPTPTEWSTNPPLPYAAGWLTSGVLSDGLHVLGGDGDYWDERPRYRNHYRYDLDRDSWSQAADVPDTDTSGAAAHVHNDRLYLVGGHVNGDFRFRAYDPETDSWETLPRIPTAFTFGFASAVVGDFLYVIGGEAGGNINAAVHKYSFTQERWLPCAPIPQNRNNGSLVAAAWGDEIYVINGDQVGGTTILQIYDTLADSWSTGPDLAAHQEVAAAAALAGKVYFFGGVRNGYAEAPYAPLDVVNIFDTATHTWSTGTPLPSARMASTVQLMDGAFHLVGGYLGSSGTPTNEHLFFHP
jgi:N-acetylneuraminic acid mutarotase